jgi:tetratricopeptide (TPR) repeat protein
MKIHSVIQRTLFSFLLVFTLSPTAISQVAGAKHEKLIDLYVMGRFEDCLLKAQKMTLNDKYKSESEPYLWVAMCLIELTKDSELEEFYPEGKTIKNALKYGVKFKKKDDKLKSKDQDYIFDQNVDFVYELIELALVDGKSFLAADNYSKASYYYKLAAKLDPDNQECQLMNGVLYLYNKNREGQAIIDSSLDYFKAQAETGGFEVNSKSERAFIDGFYYYSKYLESKGQSNEAFNVIALAIKLDPENQKFIQRYKQLSGE